MYADMLIHVKRAAEEPVNSDPLAQRPRLERATSWVVRGITVGDL
jgi:hypothetical protein